MSFSEEGFAKERRKGFTGRGSWAFQFLILCFTTTNATMLSRLLPKPSHFRALTLISSKLHSCPQPQSQFVSKTPTFTSSFAPRFFSSDRGSNNGENGRNQSDGGVWNLSQDTDGNLEPFFGAENSGNAATMTRLDGGDEWPTAEGHKPWNLAEEERSDLFDIGEVARDDGESEASSLEKQRENEIAKAEEAKRLEKEEQVLTAILKGPNRAFGDLIASSGITDEMIDSLIALKDLEGVAGLPPLAEIEELRYEKSLRKSPRAEIERQKEEEFARARVRKVDDKGRAYATGRRKCSVARVWIQPGDGKFIINDKDFDVYFPILDHRAALLRPFSDTKTLGLWDVNCTVKGGGTTGQVGAILLGISRALQNWEPDFRPPLRAAGFLTRDPRMVERKKPGKAKARKSFQWVKR